MTGWLVQFELRSAETTGAKELWSDGFGSTLNDPGMPVERPMVQSDDTVPA